MITTQNIILAVANWLFRLLIYVAATVTAIGILFGTPGVVKRTLVETNAYERFVPATIEENAKASQPSSGISLKDKETQKAIIASFPPQDLQIKAEQVVDSFYDWLNGKTGQPSYRIDFGPNIALLADTLSAQAIDRVTFLPLCGNKVETIDPFTTQCRPDVFDAPTERKKLAEEIRQSNGLLPQTVFTVNDLPKDKKGQTFVEAYPQLPVLFRIAKQTPLLLCLLTLLCGVVVVWLSRSKRKAFKQIGFALISNGVFLVISPIIFVYVLPHFTGNLQATFGEHGAQAVATDVSQALYNKLNTWLIIVGVFIIILGIAIRLLERATRPVSQYAGLKRKTGLISSIEARAANGRFKLDPAKVPLQSSEISVTKKRKRKTNKNYRKIPKGDL